jgi:hypothetical protein
MLLFASDEQCMLLFTSDEQFILLLQVMSRMLFSKLRTTDSLSTIPLAARSKALFCGLSLAGILGLFPRTEES